MGKTKHIIIVAGETSGDMHAARLVQEIKKQNPFVTFSGWGGPMMQQSGVSLYEDITPLAVIGFIEVFRYFQEFKRIFNNILKQIKIIQPDMVILVDYPGFNLRLAREIKDMGIMTRIVYYISPQVWAWKEGRVKLIKEVVDRLLVILPFEKDFYKQRGFERVEFVGHPLIDHVKPTQEPAAYLHTLGLDPLKYTISLLPGSRQQEVDQLLPVFLEAAQMLYNDNQQLQFLLIKAPNVDRRMMNELIQMIRVPIRVVTENGYDAIHASQLCLVASGTATLEVALLEKPMIILYRTSFLTWLIAKAMIKVPYIGLTNLVAGKKIVPELIQNQANSPRLKKEVQALYTNEIKLAEMKSGLKNVKTLLGGSGASRLAAEQINLMLPDF